jgi:hypothetical protein
MTLDKYLPIGCSAGYIIVSVVGGALFGSAVTAFVFIFIRRKGLPKK